MKKFLLATAAFAALSTAASAADLPRKTVAPVVAVPIFTWTGFYVGLNAGYGWANGTGSGHQIIIDAFGGLDAFFNSGGNVLPSVSPHGFIGGGQVGYNWQISPAVVVGVVADIQGSAMKESRTALAPNIGAFTNISASKEAKIDWFGTVRAKVGFAAGNFLLYGTGGLAYGNASVSTVFNNPNNGLGPVALGGSASSTKTGWAIGAGVDYALTNNLIIGAEYLYVDLGRISVTDTQITRQAIPTATTLTSRSKFTANIARVTLNYKF